MYTHLFSFSLISVPWWTSSRLALAILGFFGFVNVYALRVNMSVAIVCMVNQTAMRLEENLSSSSNTTGAISSSSHCGLIPAAAGNQSTAPSEEVKYFRINDNLI